MSKTLGELLKNAREEKNLSVDDVAKETKIQKRYILDLEEEEFDDIPGKVFEKGFLKTYINFLELEEEKLLKIYDNIRNSEMNLSEDYLEEKNEKKIKFKIFIGIISIIFMGFVAVKIIEVIDKKSKATDTVIVQEDEKIDENLEQKESNKIADISEDEIEVVTEQAIKEKITKKVEIKLLGKTWLQVFINGKKEKEGEFGANESIKYEGGDIDQIFVKIGNIKNADIFFNGQQEDESIAYKNVWKKTF